MPSDLRLLILILAGYWFIHGFDLFLYRAKTLRGHRLVIEAAIAGLFLFAPALLFVQAVKTLDRHWWSGSLRELWASTAGGAEVSATLLVSVLLAPLLAIGINLLYGFWYRDEMPEEWSESYGWWKRHRLISQIISIDRAIDRSGDALRRILHEAASRALYDQTMVGLTMSDRKLYIGWAFGAPKLLDESGYVSLVPVMSGYREPVTLEPKFNYFYPLRPYEEQVVPDAHDRLLVLPLSEIRSARLLDRDFRPEELGLSQPPPADVAP